jgi:amino acid adenylation domain-containing protein
VTDVARAAPTLAPLSFHQEGLWLADQLSPGSASYNNVLGLRLRGHLDGAALERTLAELVRRHQALRTTFDLVDERPVQRIAACLDVSLPVVDLGPVSESALLERAAEEAGRPLDLRRGPLLRPVLLRVAPDDHLLVVVLHHIVADGWSVGILVRELAAIYAAFASGLPSPLAEPRVQYADYAIRQRERLRGERMESELAHWRRQLEGAPQHLALPTDRARPAVQSSRGASHRFRWPAEFAERLRARCRAEGVTLFTGLLAAYQALLHRYSGQDDVLVGTPITNRFQTELEGVFGYFLNMLVIRADFAGDPSFRELVARVKAASIRAFSHAELPFDKLLEALRPVRDPSRSPVFQVAFALQGGAGEDLGMSGLAIPGLDVAPTEIAPQASKYDLTLCVIDAADGLTGHLEYSADLFDAGTIARMADHLEVLLDAAFRNPDLPVSRLPLLGAAERARLVYAWNDGDTDRAPDRCIHELFEAQVDRTPEATAIVVGSERWTYAELDERANRLAHRLRALGVGPERMVGLMLERSAHLAVALLGVLKAGGAYAALDAGHPAERLAYLLADARAVLVLTEEALADRRPPGGPPCLLLDGDWPSIERESGSRPANQASPANLAYAIYTSGSTGRPKAVATEHRNAASLMRWAHRAYGRDGLTGILAGSSACFDCTPFELFAPLACGGMAVLAPSSLDLPALPAADEVRLLSTVPSVIVELLREGGIPDSVRILNIGGEQLPPSLVRQVYESTRVERLYNLYGPSEATTYATRTLVPADADRVTIGRPISSARAYIVDGNLELAPIGVPGQLALAGGGLARGYLQRPDLTAERFVPNPYSEELGARLYLTGDQARFLASGDIEFIGRLDDQVKIRGIRVEPGEVQAALSAHPGVREALVVPESGPDGVRLVAYVLPAGAAPAASALRDHLRERVPAYMIPSAFVTVDAFVLAGNGKIDRQALPRPDRAGHRPYLAPRTPEEGILAGIWEDVLQTARVGVHDNFFELGGHSLLAAQVLSRMRHELGADIPLSVLFETDSLGELAERLRRAGRTDAAPPIEPAGDGPLPLSFAQQRLWFLEQFTPGGAAYNVPLAIRLRGPLDGRALAAALNEIVRRHAALRTRFRTEGGAPVQEIVPELRIEVPVTDVSGAPDGMAAALEAARAEVAAPFDLARGPLLRARLLQLGPHDHVLALVLHHIATDGWSMGVIREELAALYGACRAGRPSPLEEPGPRYADFAAWQRRWMESPEVGRQLAYWKGRLADLPALDLPTDHPRPAVRDAAGATALFKVPAAVTEELRRLARSEGATLYMALLAAFQVLLHRYSGQSDIAVGTPVAGRGRVEVERLVGFFLNTLVIRADLGGGPGFRQVLRQAKRATLEAFANQDVPFERLVEELGVRRDLSRPPLFQAMFTLQNANPGRFHLEDLRVDPVALENPTAKFELDLTMLEGDGFVYGGLNYRTGLFRPATARRMVRHFERLLAAAVAEPDRAIDELRLAGEAEVRRLVSTWSRGRQEAIPGTGVPELVATQAARTPHAVAVAAPGIELTYGELDRRANQIAHQLRELEVRPEDRVGLHVDRSPAMVVGLLGILKAGGAYVPLDPAYPVERLAGMLADSGAGVLVTEASLAVPLPVVPARVLRLDADAGAIARQPECAPPPVSSPEQLAYAVYTSGSTGRPKGVAVSHRALASVLGSFAADPGLDARDVLLAVTSLSFDIAALEILLPLTRGARVVIAEAAAVADGVRLAGLIERFAVTAVQATPITWRLLLDAGWQGRPNLLALCGGEAMPADVARRLLDAGVRLRNVYGPTETTIWSTLADVRRGEPITIGRPIANTDVHVLDRHLGPVPPGVLGELHIGGAGVARGYLGLPGQTAERFVPHPFRAGGERLYRTGDLVRLRGDGTLEFHGRLDQQLKLHGVRIEPGEIEAALAGHPGVTAAVVTMRPDGPGGGRLVAHLVAAEPGRMPGAGELRAHLRRTLPDSMVPSVFVELDDLPRTPSGKVDRAALPPPEDHRADRPAFVAPRTADERALAAIWLDVLGLDEVGVHDDFFEMGGQSLLATQVAAAVREELEVDLPLHLVFRAPTIAEFAPLLGVARANGGEWPPDLDPEACLAGAGGEAR